MDAGPLWKAVVVQLIMLALTALATVLECAAESISDNRLERLADEGDIRAVKLIPRLERVEAALPAIQTGQALLLLASGYLAAIGFADRMYAWAAGSWLAAWAPPAAMSAGVLIVTILIICIVTQTLSVRLVRKLSAARGDELALSLFGAVELAGSLLSPVYRLSAATVRGILKLMRVDLTTTSEQVTEDEIMAMVDIGEEKGAIETNEKEMIENIFEFNNKTVGACMTHRTDVSAIDVEFTDEEIVALIEETGLSRFPVYGKDIDDILGTLSTRTYLLNARRVERRPLNELIRPAYFVPETMKTDTLFREMQARKTHMAIVVDEYGGTSGLITMEDLLEEIVGNIYDEFDPQAVEDIVQLEDNLWRAAGSLELDKLCDTLGIEPMDDEEFDTLGGLVFSQLTEIPEDGSHPEVECFGLHIRVEELSDRRVEWAVVSRLETSDSDEEEE